MCQLLAVAFGFINKYLKIVKAAASEIKDSLAKSVSIILSTCSESILRQMEVESYWAHKTVRFTKF